MTNKKPDHREAVNQADALLEKCMCAEGFLASPTDSDNYRRIWARDGIIIGLAALMTGTDDMIAALGHTLETLAEHQGPHGEIPSNVDVRSGRVSYGGMTGRVDADLWFVIGCGEYWQATKDDAFIEHMLPSIEKVVFLLGAWEFNNRGLLYVPATGDWADEYVHTGYILYDQLLYLQTLRTIHHIRRHVTGCDDHDLHTRISLLKHRIRANYWFGSDEKIPDDVYHEILFEKGRKAANHCTRQYWLPFFSPHGYGYRFDGFANVLASLLDVSPPSRRQTVDAYIEQHVVPDQIKLLPAFYPVIKPLDKDWEDLQITFSYSFKNHPYEFHNGGLWPMITGFYVADLARRGETDKAGAYLAGIHCANAMCMDGQPWGFPEYVNGSNFSAGGNRHQGWSASAAVMGHAALKGKKVFRINEDDTFVQ
ncbi:amylo-alpha-1,6-glucosidase [Desulfosarcina sp.]|uniref:amylo-alpha-1,6-glucosidase n=1 Tax=Desulfosarcina sp. TaxID=2027861 RepID=UPI0039706972